MIDEMERLLKGTGLHQSRKQAIPPPAVVSGATQSTDVSTQPRNGWDPHGVWLSRIHEPRRRAAAAGRR